MIKTLIFFAILLAIAFGGSWLADRPGRILIEWPWLDTGFDVSLLVGFMLLVAAMAVAIILWVVVRGIWKSPQSVSGFFSSRRRDKGYKALSTGMIAVGVGDLALARKQASKARKLIGAEPMTLMLEAQAAQLAGDATKARQSFEAMLDQDDTRALGRRGLYIEAQRRGDAEEALEMARAATAEGKKTPGWAGAALFDMQTGAHDWQGALITLSQNHNDKHVSKEQFRRHRAVILTAQAMDMEEGTDQSMAQSMRPLLLEACKLAPGLVPAVVKGADVLTELGEQRKATKLIETAWRVEPHPDLAKCYAYIKNGDTALERLKRIRSLYALMPDHLESKIAMARACLDAREWAEARSLIEPLAEAHLTPRLCMLMAELEEGEKHDFGLVRQWLARAVGAHRDPAWTADGQVSENWQPTSPVTGKLDAFEWKVPVQEMAQASQPVIENSLAADDAEGDEDLVLISAKGEAEDIVDVTDLGADDAKEGVIEGTAAASADTTPVVDAAEPDSAAQNAEASADSAKDAAQKDDADEPKKAVEVKQASKPSEAKVEAEGAEDTPDMDPVEPLKQETKPAAPKREKPKEVEFPLSHAPDDPGPKKEALPPSPEKRFRLF